jgi:hypothetical protein
MHIIHRPFRQRNRPITLAVIPPRRILVERRGNEADGRVRLFEPLVQVRESVRVGTGKGVFVANLDPAQVEGFGVSELGPVSAPSVSSVSLSNLYRCRAVPVGYYPK